MASSTNPTSLDAVSRNECPPPQDRLATEQDGTYEYERLPPGSMRVFELFISDDWNSPVEGQLRIVEIPTIPATGMMGLFYNFDEAVRYEALSYAWGPTYADGSHLSHSILCNGRRLPVTANLLQALKRLRARDRRELILDDSSDSDLHEFVADAEGGEVGPFGTGGTLLWIDAICINQRDKAERSLQVAEMYHIFQAAQGITAWLGEPPLGEERELMLELFSDTKAAPSRAAVVALLRLPWFHRRWVVQEVFSRGRYAFLLGKHECSHTKLWAQIERHEMVHLVAGPLQSTYGRSTLLQTMFVYRDTECSDPLDRIYALRGIASDGLRVHVDYSHSVHDAYLQASLAVTYRDAGLATFLTRGPGMVRLPPPCSPVDILRLFVLASCFKTDVTRTEGEHLEGWMPDWRTRAMFASREHEGAVWETILGEPSVQNPPQGASGFPDAAVIGHSGRWVLRVPGRALRRAVFVAQSAPWATIYSGEGETRLLESDAPSATTVETVWLPVEPGELEGEESFVPAFVLRPGVTKAAAKGWPMYRLHRCLSLRRSSEIIFNACAPAEGTSPHSADGNEFAEYFYLE